ncbi:MAG: IMP dehydrogenase [Chloroflexi bacterium]|nr:IMP dehydrogenase [Chloroflexota bacterium]
MGAPQFKEIRRTYGFDDVAIAPGLVTLNPEQTNIEFTLREQTFAIPILASAMDAVVSPAFAVRMGKLGGLPVLNLEGIWSRYDDPEAALLEIAETPLDSVTELFQRIYSMPVKEELIGRRVFNLSMPTGFIGYDKLLRYAAAKGADVNNVIIAVSMDSDIGVYENQTPAMDTVTAKEPTSSLFRRIKGFLTNQSALYLLTTTLIRRSPVLNDMAARAGLFVPNLEAVRKNEFSEQAIDSSARFLAKIAARYRTTVAVLPSRALWLGSRQAIEAKRHARFISRLKELGIVAVDLRTAFEDRGDPLAYHFDNDPHWKPSGHLRAAQALAAENFGSAATWSHPAGAMYIWGHMPEGTDLSSVQEKAVADADVGFHTGVPYAPDGVSGKNHFRLCFGYNSPEEIQEGIGRLAGVFEKEGLLKG